MQFFKKYKHYTRKALQAGFTLVEMVVVTGIFAVITAVTIFNYGAFTSNMLVTNMAYEIALAVRQAQVFGLGARGYTDGGTASFDQPYGVFIQLSENEDGEYESRRFQFFADTNDDLQCSNTAGTGNCTCASDECTEQITLQRNIRITDIRLSHDEDTCLADETNQVSITYERPNPEARIKPHDYGSSSDYEFVQIEVSAPGSSIDPSYILIRKTGQISVSTDDICTTVN